MKKSVFMGLVLICVCFGCEAKTETDVPVVAPMYRGVYYFHSFEGELIQEEAQDIFKLTSNQMINIKDNTSNSNDNLSHSSHSPRTAYTEQRNDGFTYLIVKDFEGDIYRRVGRFDDVNTLTTWPFEPPHGTYKRKL